MDVSKIAPGDNPPEFVNAVIEIPQGGLPVKYEIDKDSGALFVDRFLHTSMIYPANYGFVPGTLAEDGDPCDVLVVTPTPVSSGAVIRCRIIGVLMMSDEKGPDEKHLAVPIDKLNPFYTNVRSYQDLPPLLIEQIKHFFSHYKDLEPGKRVSESQWHGPDKAFELVRAGILRGMRLSA
ncbi:MAG TPA: inorganic diphosphatase [Hyphomonadaceae bacterium]|jgi:Inorganic pyrophosphatase|nr:inorganic diphosphatase [Hyphomonadaceae bacterium]